MRHRWIAPTYFVLGTCVILTGLSCPPGGSVPPRDVVDENSIALFFSGDELGALKPCGCSGGQLGGLEKRPAVFGTVPPAKRMVVETGALVKSDGVQDLIKFRIFQEAFGLIGYDVVHLTAQDVAISDRLGLSEQSDRPYKIITAQSPAGPSNRPSVATKEFTVNGRNVSVVIGSVDAEIDPVEKALGLWDAAAGQTVKVLILQNAGDNALDDWAARSGADCIVCPSRTDEPEVLSPAKAKPLIFSTGRFGRHLSRLDIRIPSQNQAMEVQLRDIPVDEKLTNDEALVQLYKQYQVLVRDSNLLEAYPRVPLPNYLQYIGSKRCESCHLYEFTQWNTQLHARAFATLEKVGSDADPECVVCHVVGMDREGGFVTPLTTPQMKDVGCEVCHGPGLEHLRGGGYVKTTEPKITCVQCHTPEHSGGYAGHEEEYRKKIVHWMEP